MAGQPGTVLAVSGPVQSRQLSVPLNGNKRPRSPSRVAATFRGRVERWSRMRSKRMSWPGRPGALLVGVLVCGLSGCRTPLPRAVDLADGTWRVQRGQAVWTPRQGRAALAGDLVLATRAGGDCWVQFAKEPFPLVTAQADATGWRITFVPEERSVHGRGRLSPRWVWLQLPRVVAAREVEPPWHVQTRPGGAFHLRHPATGEELQGFLQP